MVGWWHNFCILSWLVWLREQEIEEKDTLILQGESRRGPKYFEKYRTADRLNLF